MNREVSRRALVTALGVGLAGGAGCVEEASPNPKLMTYSASIDDTTNSDGKLAVRVDLDAKYDCDIAGPPSRAVFDVSLLVDEETRIDDQWDVDSFACAETQTTTRVYRIEAPDYEKMSVDISIAELVR